MRRELERIEIPGAAAAEERALLVVAAGFDERRPPPPRRTPRGPLVAVVVAAAIVAAVLSPPGRAVVDHVRRAVGIDHSQAALFSLPTQGRLLVVSGSGVWVVQPDGSRRLIGAYDEASWSPLGRFVVAARRNELAALDADGSVRWTLARPLVRFPRWSGSATDTRIAYLSGDRLHVVAGDGRSDADVGGRPVAPVAPGWRRGPGFVLAYAGLRGQITSLLTAKGAALGPRPPRARWARRARSSGRATARGCSPSRSTESRFSTPEAAGRSPPGRRREPWPSPTGPAPTRSPCSGVRAAGARWCSGVACCSASRVSYVA